MLHLLLKGLLKIFPSLENSPIFWCLLLGVGLYFVVQSWCKRWKQYKNAIWVEGEITSTHGNLEGEGTAEVRYIFDGKECTATVDYHPDLFKKDIGKKVKLGINPTNIRQVSIKQGSQNLQLWVITVLLVMAGFCFLMAAVTD